MASPSRTGSPSIVLAPAPPTIAIKTTNASNMISGSTAMAFSAPPMITRKEWVIPPRPKPGRKPATDTPPTKRKAQNRAAQRAFRERRAARVGELEEQLEETKEEQQKRESEMRAKILRLEVDLERFNGELHSWRVRCDTLDRIADYERREKEAALAELSYLRNGARTTGTDAVPLPPRRPRQTEQRVSGQQQFVQSMPSPAPDIEAEGCGRCTSTGRCSCVEETLDIEHIGCGKCSAGSHCECLDGTFNAIDSQLPNTTDPKRPLSPTADFSSEKRVRQSEPSTPLEIDFTAQFARKPVIEYQQIHELPPQARPPIESCGFCEEGTYCVCAEAAAANSALEREHGNRLAPLLNEVTPPPSDNDVDGSMVRLPSLQTFHMHRSVTTLTPADSCVNGPGTCKQCLSDPKSGLFCRTLAAMRASNPSNPAPPGDCCGGNTSGGGCCKSIPTVTPTQPPPTLSCADTYKTLSSHRNFDQASDELNAWLGKLNAAPPVHAGRAPLEVEAASVMGVLKLFDRRFGRG